MLSSRRCCQWKLRTHAVALVRAFGGFALWETFDGGSEIAEKTCGRETEKHITLNIAHFMFDVLMTPESLFTRSWDEGECPQGVFSLFKSRVCHISFISWNIVCAVKWLHFVESHLSKLREPRKKDLFIFVRISRSRHNGASMCGGRLLCQTRILLE